ncbi:MAG: efflux transporter outer membrane subunit [Vicinamibacterales bacterium]
MRPAHLHLFGGLALALLLPGCATTGSMTATPVDTVVPTRWTSAGQDVVEGTSDLSRWWEGLGDATLDALVERAVTSSLDLQTAEARVRQARAQRLLAASALVPAVSASGTASDQRHGNALFSAGFDASWEPDVFGGNRKTTIAAAADAAATVADLHAAEVSLTGELGRAYFDLRTEQARLAIARRNEASQAETLELTGFRAQAGLVGDLDVQRARANLEQTRAQIPAIEARLAQGRHAIAVLCGAAPSALDGLLAAPATLPDVPARIGIGVPFEVLRQRPDIRAAERRVVAETARTAAARTARYPQFGLSGSIGANLVAGAATGGASLAASAAASLFQTIFDGGRIRQQIAVQDAVLEQAVLAYEAAVLAALQDVEDALASLEASRQQLASLTAAADAAQRAADLARTEYQAGLIDFQAVLDAERTQLSVEDAVATTTGDRLTALVQLYKALGGGWLPAADASGSAERQP